MVNATVNPRVKTRSYESVAGFGRREEIPRFKKRGYALLFPFNDVVHALPS